MMMDTVPPKTVEQTRKLVESDEVLFIFGSLGTAHNAAIRRYMNEKKVPQLFISTGGARFNDPKQYPWTMPFLASFQSEGRIDAKYLLANHPHGKIGVLYQNDDFGKDYLKGLKDGLNGKMQIVAEMPYEVSDPTIDSQIVTLEASGADIFYNVTTPKFGGQAIKKITELGWKPIHVVSGAMSSVGAALRPAGLDNAKGILLAGWGKDPTDPTWRNDPAIKEWLAFMDKYYPDGDKTSAFTAGGYMQAATLVQVLKRCGDDLTRENIMKQATNLKDLEMGMLLPGIKINTSPTDFAPIKQFQMQRFNGASWELFGPIMTSEVGG
jgi:branched-chain amino acid transport system substrate-binding protein